MTTTTTSSSGDLSIIEADSISDVLFDIFSEYCFTERFNKQMLLTYEEALGAALTNAMTIYLDMLKSNKKKTNIKKGPDLADIITPTHIIVKGVNPQIHQKFRKKIKKEYGPQNFDSGYNLVLNIIIGYYIKSFQIPMLMYSQALINTNAKIGKQIPPLIKSREYITYDIFKEEFHAACQDYGLNTTEEKEAYELCELIL